MSFATETTHAASPVTTMPSLPPVAQKARREGERAVDGTERHKKVSEEEAQKIVRDINSALETIHTELNFSVDKETDRMVLKVVNSKTHEVIRQIPAEDALRLASRISKLLGVLIDENA